MAYADDFNSLDDFDGRWWNELNKSEKRKYVIGFFGGSEDVLTRLVTFSLDAAIDPQTGKLRAERANAVIDAASPVYAYLENNTVNVTIGQLVDGLDQTYRDYRNQRIPVHRGISVVADGIKGATEQEVTRRVEEMRKEASQ